VRVLDPAGPVRDEASDGPVPATTARHCRQEYLLQRRLFRRRTTGESPGRALPAVLLAAALALRRAARPGPLPPHWRRHRRSPHRGRPAGPRPAAARRHQAAREHPPGQTRVKQTQESPVRSAGRREACDVARFWAHCCHLPARQFQGPDPLAATQAPTGAGLLTCEFSFAGNVILGKGSESVTSGSRRQRSSTEDGVDLDERYGSRTFGTVPLRSNCGQDRPRAWSRFR
jgi:hypothetical protein